MGPLSRHQGKQSGLWSGPRVGQGAPALSGIHNVAPDGLSWHGPGRVAVPGRALIGVAHAASGACHILAGLGTRSQEPIGDRVLLNDVLHPGDVQEGQQHP